jgi:hypothetical protein
VRERGEPSLASYRTWLCRDGGRRRRRRRRWWHRNTSAHKGTAHIFGDDRRPRATRAHLRPELKGLGAARRLVPEEVDDDSSLSGPFDFRSGGSIMQALVQLHLKLSGPPSTWLTKFLLSRSLLSFAPPRNPDPLPSRSCNSYFRSSARALPPAFSSQRLLFTDSPIT